jgi:hypothetical protein
MALRWESLKAIRLFDPFPNTLHSEAQLKKFTTIESYQSIATGFV